MKKRMIKHSIVSALFTITLLFPYILNNIINPIMSLHGKEVSFSLDEDAWFKLWSIAMPSLLSYFLIEQSEQQHKATQQIQSNMDRVNSRMLEMELKEKRGYFTPKIETTESEKNTSKTQPFFHNLQKYITFINSGEDTIFLKSVETVVNGKMHSSKSIEPVCFLNTSPFNEWKMETDFTKEELSSPQLNLKITITMENSKGYAYQQVITLGVKNFHRHGEVNAFNMVLQEVPSDAD